jgi:thiol-disulfide isomerase/thioredoxin
MKYILQIFFLFLTNLLFAQNNFKIKLIAPTFENDSLIIGAPMSGGNTQKIYNFETLPNQNMSFFKDISTILVRIKSENLIEGKIPYPQPFSISYYEPEINRGQESKLFFIEKGNFQISLSRDNNLDFTLESYSPANLEYKKLKSQLLIYDEKQSPFEENVSNKIEAKQKYLQSYISKHPNSYVAFWEIVRDFSRYGFKKSYLKSLSLFSKSIKNIYSFVEFKKIVDIENSTNVGGNFPEVIFNSSESITKVNFSGYKLTLIDYWATFCMPCIEDLPKLVALYEKYKKLGVNFISVTDESKQNKIELATKILNEKNVTWRNYFDTNKEFPKQLNASGYPLQILVDNNGKIIARELGALDQIEIKIKRYIE